MRRLRHYGRRVYRASRSAAAPASTGRPRGIEVLARMRPERYLTSVLSPPPLRPAFPLLPARPSVRQPTTKEQP